MTKELAWSYEGDLQIYQNQIRTVENLEDVARMAIFWTRTYKGSWKRYAHIGTQLSNYLGSMLLEENIAVLQDNFNSDLNGNNYFPGYSFAFQVDSVDYVEGSVYTTLYILTPNEAIETLNVVIDMTNIEIAMTKDPYDPPEYYPEKTFPRSKKGKRTY